MSERNHVLQMENITMQFGGVVAVNNLSLEVNEGEIVALIGPNGAGKTTAFNVITGVYQPTNGQVLFHDKAYVCNRYASGGKDACSSHYINQKALAHVVLLDIRSKSMWAQFGRAEIREKLLAQKESAGREKTKTLQAELSAIDRRLPELDRLVQSAYEDKVLGKIPENLCVQLLNGYEAERKAKQERRRELTEQLAASRENEQSVDAWLDMVQDYYNLEELDRPTLVRLIQKIEVGEKRMVDGHEERDFNIYYNFIGHIDL